MGGARRPFPVSTLCFGETVQEPEATGRRSVKLTFRLFVFFFKNVMFAGKKLFIFDLDGTLLNSLDIWDRVDVEIIRRVSGVAPDPRELEAFRKAVLREVADRKDAYVLYCGAIAKRWNLDIAQEDLHAKRYETAREMLVSAVDWREGAADFVRAARTLGFRTAVATTTKRRNVDIYSRENEGMRREGVLYDLFDAVVTREDVCAIKPDPECHRLLAERLGVTADETLVFEDSLIGLDAAKAAGMEVAVIDEPHSDAERAELNERADFTFRDWPSLQAVLLAECGSHKEVR